MCIRDRRYTVPKYIHTDRMEEKLTGRFLVGDVYKGCYICTYFDDTCVKRQKRPVMAPGEMEEIKLQKQKLEEYPDLKKITIRIEKGGE